MTSQDFRLPALALLVMTVALLLSGVLRSLTPSEAMFLLRVPDRAAVQISSSDMPVHLQAAWATMAGSMERPARFLAILSTFVGLGLCGIALTRQLGGTPAAAGLLALGSLPWFWDSAVGIGTDAPLFCVTAATSLVVFGKRTGVLAAMLFTAILIAAWGIWPSLWMAACPIIAWGVALVWTKLSRAQSMGITAVLLAAMLILVFGSRGESNAAHVERLDWIRTHVDSRATLMIHGQGRHIIRYYQTAHHRTGHPTLEVDPNTDFAALAQRLYLERHPLLVVLGCSESLDAALGRHFGGEDIHDGVRIYRLGQ